MLLETRTKSAGSESQDTPPQVWGSELHPKYPRGGKRELTP